MDGAGETVTKRGEQLRETLQAHGLRYSRPREVILSFFGERDRHVSAEELHLELRTRGENLSLSTVYLNLGVLKQAGLVREVGGVGGEAFYDFFFVTENNVIFTRCGTVVDLPEVLVSGTPLAELLKRQAEALLAWRVGEPDIGIRGVCPDCQDAGR